MLLVSKGFTSSGALRRLAGRPAAAAFPGEGPGQQLGPASGSDANPALSLQWFARTV